MTPRVIQAVAGREVVTLFRTRSYPALVLGVTAVLLGLAVAGEGASAGFLPAATDLLLPVELVVPVVAVAVGYGSIAADARRGELEVLDTYPVPPWAYVLGVYLGRGICVLVAVLVPLALVGGYVALAAESGTDVIASHTGVDSVAVFVRFAVLSGALALVALALALVVSALAWSRGTAILLAVLLLAFVLVGGDLVLLRGVGTGVLGRETVTVALALSPTSAFRGLVLETVVPTTLGTDRQFASPLASALGLFVWTVASLVVTTVAVSRR